MAVALAVPDKAEKIYAIVGATGVCVVSYIIPVYVHLQVLRAQKATPLQAPLEQEVRHQCGGRVFKHVGFQVDTGRWGTRRQPLHT